MQRIIPVASLKTNFFLVMSYNFLGFLYVTPVVLLLKLFGMYCIRHESTCQSRYHNLISQNNSFFFLFDSNSQTVDT